ncbi:hypothetical protein C4D51_09850 [Clostridium perfringens]|nr:hypothetical protein [Clostridium perfringens]
MGKKILEYILSVFCLIFVIMIGIGLYYINARVNKVKRVEVNKYNLSVDKYKVKEEKHIKNIVLFGIYVHKGKVGRSNTIMIIILDKEHKVMRVTSL